MDVPRDNAAAVEALRVEIAQTGDRTALLVLQDVEEERGVDRLWTELISLPVWQDCHSADENKDRSGDGDGDGYGNGDGYGDGYGDGDGDGNGDGDGDGYGDGYGDGDGDGNGNPFLRLDSSEWRASMDDIRIVVLPQAWILVGYYSRDGLFGRVQKARCIRVWGTVAPKDSGLGLLAQKGPQPTTVLDLEGDSEWPLLRECRTIKCNVEAWKPILDAEVK